MTTDEMLKSRKTVEADLLTWMAIHGNLSLALRHPQNKGPSRAYVARFVKRLGQWLVEQGVVTQEELECHYALESEEGGIEETEGEPPLE